MAINIEQIRDFLLQNKSLSIEKIGTISIDNTPVTNEDGTFTSSTHFKYNKKAETTEGLYKYIADLQQKNINLVRSDVDSFFEESRQLMNIGSRPIHFQGIGYIYHDRNHGYNFSENSPLGFKESIPENINEDISLTAIPSYNRNKYNNATGLKVLLSIIILVLIGGIGYFIYSLFNEKKLNKIEATDTETMHQADSIAEVQPIVQNNVLDSTNKKFVFETTSSMDRLNKRTTQLRNMGKTILVDTVELNGEKMYKMYVTIPVENLIDTTHVKDSLFILFGKRVIIE